jgi:hypothetical protein
MPPKTKRSMWIDEALEATMGVVERGTHSLRRANMSWNIPMNSNTDHLNGKTKSKKMGLGGVLTKEEDVVNDQVDLKHVRKWTVHKPITIQDDGRKANINKDAPF